jgi:hypothetical protein
MFVVEAASVVVVDTRASEPLVVVPETPHWIPPLHDGAAVLFGVGVAAL